MWRKTYHEDDWERKKTYLLRSYFEDVSRLSPVEENDEYRNSDDFPIEFRSESPLPELIIERVSKQNHHDEPEEFYERLQVVVQNYVDRLKRHGSSESRTINLSEISCVNNDDIRSSLLESSCERDINNEPGSFSDCDDENNEVDRDNENSSIKSSASRDASQSRFRLSNDNEESVESNYQADVHTEKCDNNSKASTTAPHSNDDVENILFPSKEISPLNITAKQGGPVTTNENHESQEENISEHSEKSVDSSNNADLSNNQERPELMRAGDSDRFLDSFIFSVDNAKKRIEKNINNFRFSNESLDSENIANRAFIEEIESVAFTPETQQARFSLDDSAHSNISTQNGTDNVDSSSASFGVASIALPSPPKRSRVEKDVGVQTDNLHHDFVDWEQLKHDFFIGTPTIYKLCKCSNHSCS